jgi:hypothetical protein
MRAKEFLTEKKKRGKLTKRQKYASVGMTTFRDPDGYDRTYELNRLMMAVACADGGLQPVELNKESWAGKDNTAHPFTQIEQDMLTQAAKSIGSKLHDQNRGDYRSMELPDTNKVSPVTGFKGFKKK